MNLLNNGDTAFVLICAALVLLMTPGLAFFYGGMVRRKNVLNTMMSSFFIMGLASVMWVLIGYTMSFGPDAGAGIIGTLKWLGLNGVSTTTAGPYILHSLEWINF
jgi:Amt family ammonium transporter